MTILLARPRSRFRPSLSLAALAAFVLTAALPAVASAQGRCSCNSGCHQFPGQCVQGGSAGCESGFAPFCGTRPTTCPNAGWVSCSGDCTCVRIAPLDAGVPDAGRADVSLPTDAPALVDRGTATDTASPSDVPASMDLGVSFDVPASMDVRPANDVPAAQDLGLSVDVGAARDALVSIDVGAAADVPGRDAPAVDVVGADGPTSVSDVPVAESDAAPTGADAPVATFDGGVPALDAAPGLDAPGSASDAAAAGDDGCVCVGGACLGNVCYRERCTYNPELGFTCATPGTTCRLVGGDPYCVPLCAGVSCAAGEFCDERSNGACVADRCASIECPVGTTCVHNQCGRWSGADGGAFVTEDGGGVEADGGGTAPPTATDTGCGCRVGEQTGDDGRWGLPAALLALFGLGGGRRRRARRAAG